MKIWSFIGMTPATVAKLGDAAKSRIVRRPGIYILFTSDGPTYRYPKGDSPIFYIGMSNALCDRIDTHRRRVQAIVDKRMQGLEWPRYEYAAAHGCQVAAFVLATGPDFDCGSLEDDAVALFAKEYGAPPIANGAASRDKVLRRRPTLPPRGLTAEPWFDVAGA